MTTYFDKFEHTKLKIRDLDLQYFPIYKLTEN